MAPIAEPVKPLLVIPMTGISSRFTAAGYDRPKFLVEIDGQTVVEHVVDMYPGWDDVVFVCNATHLDDPRFGLEELLLRKRPSGHVVRAEELCAGPGEAVLLASDLIDPARPVVVNYCDFTGYWDADLLAERLSSGEVDGVIPCYTGDHPHMRHSTSYAYVKMDGGRVVDIQEKQPWTDDPSSEPASSGTYGFASGEILLRALRDQMEAQLLLKGEYYLSLTYKPMLQQGARVEVQLLQHFMQWGTPQDLEEYVDVSATLARWTAPRVVGTSRHGASRVLLASGAGSRFVEAGYTVPKPALPIAGRPALEHVAAGVPGERTVVVTRRDLPDHGVVSATAEALGAEVVSLDGVTEGQAVSARHGLLPLVERRGPVTVGACDALAAVDAAAFDRAVDLVGDDGLVVWLASPYPPARRDPRAYGWAVADEGGLLTRTWLKQEPDDDRAGVMIGTFTFASAASGVAHVDDLVADDDRVRGEFYLDSLVDRLLRRGIPVAALVVDAFAAVGTPAEYEALRYWQSCLHKWSLHPYALAADPLVPADARADLDHEFRRFDPHALST